MRSSPQPTTPSTRRGLPQGSCPGRLKDMFGNEAMIVMQNNPHVAGFLYHNGHEAWGHFRRAAHQGQVGDGRHGGPSHCCRSGRGPTVYPNPRITQHHVREPEEKSTVALHSWQAPEVESLSA
jgi:hypothetical protein